MVSIREKSVIIGAASREGEGCRAIKYSYKKAN